VHAFVCAFPNSHCVASTNDHSILPKRQEQGVAVVDKILDFPKITNLYSWIARFFLTGICYA